MADERTEHRRNRIVSVAVGLLTAAATLAAAFITVGAAVGTGKIHVGTGPKPTITARVTTTVTATPGAAAPDTSAAPTSDTAGQWFYLADLEPLDTQNGRNCTGGCTAEGAQSVTLGGIVYPRSRAIGLASSGYDAVVSWNASNHCTKFQATVGLTDTSATVTAQFQAALDGHAPINLATVTTGHPRSVTVDLTGVFRYQLEAHLGKAVIGDSTGQFAAWGDARMLCSSTP